MQNLGPHTQTFWIRNSGGMAQKSMVCPAGPVILTSGKVWEQLPCIQSSSQRKRWRGGCEKEGIRIFQSSSMEREICWDLGLKLRWEIRTIHLSRMHTCLRKAMEKSKIWKFWVLVLTSPSRSRVDTKMAPSKWVISFTSSFKLHLLGLKAEEASQGWQMTWRKQTKGDITKNPTHQLFNLQCRQCSHLPSNFKHFLLLAQTFRVPENDKLWMLIFVLRTQKKQNKTKAGGTQDLSSKLNL